MTDARREDECRSPISSQSQLEQETASSDYHFQPSTLNPVANIQNRHPSLEALNLAGEEETSETRETYPMPREEEDDNLLGRSLFEKDRDSRRSLIIELHHEMNRTSNLINEEDEDEQVGNRVIDRKNAGTCHTATSHNPLTRTDIANSGFENWTFNAKAELRAPNLMEEQSKPDPRDGEDALERTKDTQSTGSSIAKSKGSKMEEVLPTWNNKTHANIDSAEDQVLYENQQRENSPVPGQSARMPKDEVKQSFISTAMHDSETHNRKENVALDNRYRSNYLSSTYGQTQNVQDAIQKQTKQTILEGEKDETTAPIGIGEEYTFQQRDERESRDGQNEPVVNKDFCQAFTGADLRKRETLRSSLNVYDTVPDGPIGTSNGTHNSSIDLMALRNIEVVDGPMKRVGNNLQIRSGLLLENANGMLTSRRQIVDETNCEELHPGTRRSEKLRASQQSRKDTSFRYKQFAILGGDVLVNGGAIDSLRKEDKMVNGPTLTDEAFTTSQYGTEGICDNKMKPFQWEADRDEVDGPVYSVNSDANVKDPQGFGGARPKQISRNSTRQNSSTKTKITEPISACQHNETGEFGLELNFLEGHTVKSNGAILDLSPQNGRDEFYFSARACRNTTYDYNLGLSGEGINLPGSTSSSSSQVFYAQAAVTATTPTRCTAQSPSIHQKTSIDQKESWHFPCHESPIPQSNFHVDQGLCVSQPNANWINSSDKTLFGSRRTGGEYNEMDSMTNEYHNSMGNADDGMVKLPAVSDGHHSSTEDSSSSLLGSLQQLMSKTVNLIASSNAAAKQPQKEPNEAVKLSIQEETRGSREQEQAVRTAGEDSRNQEESTQYNEETERQPIFTPVQETPRPVCSHYQRRCLVRFPCCEKFYPCHRCHNESKDCSNDQARATNATHIRCSICYHEQVVRC